MSAAPVVTSSANDEKYLTRHAKRSRWVPISNGGGSSSEAVVFASALSSLQDCRHMESLQADFPEQSTAFLASVLEASGGKLESARAVLRQILSQVRLGGQNRHKRRRSCSSSDSGKVEEQVEEVSCSGADVLLDRMMAEVEGCRSMEDIRRRLSPAFRELAERRARPGSEKMQRLLTRTILNQGELIGNMRARLSEQSRALLAQLQESERTNEALRAEVKRLRDVNSRLSFFIASNYQDGPGGNNNNFPCHRQPDVF